MKTTNTTIGPMNRSSISQDQIHIIGEEILRRMEGASKVSLFSKDYWYGSIMDWSMKNEKFKTNMFRFVDVLPSLQSSQELTRHLKEYFSENGQELPGVFNVGIGLGSLAPGLMASAIRKNVTQMATMFISGENPDQALPVLKKARKNKMAFTVDILGEATLSEKEALEYQQRYLELISWLAKDAQQWEEISQIDRDADGEIPKVNVSVKMTALYSQINDKAWDQTKTILKERLRPIFRSAMEKKVFLNLDMEQYSVKHLTFEVFVELMDETEFRAYPFFGCVVQAYLRDSFSDLKELVAFAKRRGTPFTVRLVKGAYWDYETVDAEQKSWPIPVYTNKRESDANYELCCHYLFENYPYIRVAVASHNVRTLAAAMTSAQLLKVPKDGFELQMLYGMADPIKKAVIEMGYRLREYAPVGDLIPGMAYLVRRLLENTSNESWLRGKFAEGKTTAELLADPAQGLVPSSPNPVQKEKFYNQSPVDFAIKNQRTLMIQELDKIRSQLDARKFETVLPIVDGEARQCAEKMVRPNPSSPTQIVCEVGFANIDLAETAIQSAAKFFKQWKTTDLESRCLILEKAAQIMLERRFQLAAQQVYEVGKPWAEATGDVEEAIDFCRYYARDMRQLGRPKKLAGIPGESNFYSYRARGVVAVIAPWNFPLAILTGQVVSALVTGNTVVMKPAEQSSWIAKTLYQILIESGVPKNALQFLPGNGEIVGAYIVKHPQISTIAFTGSKAVGLEILKNAQEVKTGQNQVKRCIIEMGGKNAVIIDNDADLDEAIDGVLYSAFGFSGQKCSAASRCIVLDEVYDKFIERLVAAAKSVHIGPSTDPSNYTGPVVDAETCSRILTLIKNFEQNHQLLFKGNTPQQGFFVPLTIFGNVDSKSDLAQKEIFGPVLAVIKAKNLEEAIQIANSTEYALTGGLFSRSPANIKYARENLDCGNLYINRGITGAMVDRHPFGGFKMSGVGSKTGGPDYLLQYLEPVTITENTLRRGFAPAEGLDGN